MLGLGFLAAASVTAATVWRLNHAPPGAEGLSTRRPHSESVTKPAASAAPGSQGPSVELAFDWPTGELGKLELTQVRERTGVAPVKATVRYDVHVAETGKGRLRISYENPVPVSSANQPKPQPLDLINPALIVSEKGELLQVDGQAELIKKMAATVKGTPGAPPQDQLSLLLAAVIQARAHNGWDSLVTSWAGSDLPLKGTVPMIMSDLSPVPEAPPLKIATKVRTKGMVPCSTRKGAPTCLSIETTGTPDEASTRVLAQALRQQMGAPGASLDFKSLEIRVKLLTEPGTLLPHRHELEREFTVQVAQGGEQQTIRQTERQVQEFTYTERQR